MRDGLNPDRVREFIRHYEAGLRQAIVDKPQDYPWVGSLDISVVVDRMRQAIADGTYNHGGRGFLLACRSIGIKHTKTSIEAYLRERS